MKVLNWRKLSVSMKARYGAWKAASDVTWLPKFNVTVTHSSGKKLKVPCVYPFEDRLWTETCRQWWLENGCLAEVKEANT